MCSVDAHADIVYPFTFGSIFTYLHDNDGNLYQYDKQLNDYGRASDDEKVERASTVNAVSISGQPNPSISGSATVSATSPTTYDGYADAETVVSVQFLYQFEFDGDDGTIPVSLIGRESIDLGSLRFDSRGYADVEVYKGDYTYGGAFASADIRTDDQTGTKSASRDFDLSFDADANTVYTVALFASFDTYACGACDVKTNTGSFVIDPYLKIDDPALASSYTLSESFGVGNQPEGMSPVPLPRSAPLFGAALAMLGSVGYMARRKSGTAA